MPETPETPATPNPLDPLASQRPLLAGLDARRLVADVLEVSGPLSFAVDWQAPSPEQLGDLLAGYEIERMLGRGGMGAVYLATEKRLDRRVAIKLLPPELGQRQDFRQRFEREAWILAQLDHANIVRLYGLGESDDGHLYLVMEYIEGTNLSDVLRQAREHHRPGTPLMPWPRIVEISTQLCQALGQAHSQGLVHRDLKPANVLLTQHGLVKLVDFGLARPVDGATSRLEDRNLMTQTGQMMGTYDYMAPEQHNGLPGDHRVDIYSMGVLLYQMLTGSLPRGAFGPPSTLAGVSRSIDLIVRRTLADDPDARTPNALALKADLLACPPDGRDKWWDRRAVRSAAAVVAAVGLATAFWSIANRPPAASGLAPTPPGLSEASEERRSFLGHVMYSLPRRPYVYVAEAETTVGQYRQFVEETGRPATPAQRKERVGDPLSTTLTWDEPGQPQDANDPVVGVSWQDAQDFTHWMTRQALASGELLPGQEYRLTEEQDWLHAFKHISPTRPGAPGMRVEEWTGGMEDFLNRWPPAMVSSARLFESSGSPTPKKVPSPSSTGHTDRGFRIVLDAKNAKLRPLSAEFWKAAETLNATGAPGQPSVQVLVTPETKTVDLSRRPDIQSLEPLRGLGLAGLKAAPAIPLDLEPLRAEPLVAVSFSGPVVSLAPLAECPLATLILGNRDRLASNARSTPPSLEPMLLRRPLTRLEWHGFNRGPDIVLRQFPLLSHFNASDCELPTLDFLERAALESVTLERTDLESAALLQPLRQVRSLTHTETLMEEPDRRALAGDLDGALKAAAEIMETLAPERWFNQASRTSLARRTRRWLKWRALGLGPWLQAGAVGPPPGSVEWRGRWFYYLDDDMTRQEAQSCAINWGGYLATLADPEEEAFVRSSVVPQGETVVRAHLGAWRPSGDDPWQWYTGEPWSGSHVNERRTGPPGSFLVFKSGPDRWYAERERERESAVLIEWGAAEESAALRALETRVQGTWQTEKGARFELRPRGQIGPMPMPGDHWLVVEAVDGEILVSRNFGQTRKRLTTTDDPNQLTVTVADGSTQTATRQQPE